MKDEQSRKQNQSVLIPETVKHTVHVPATAASATRKKVTKIDIGKKIAGYKQAATKHESEGNKQFAGQNMFPQIISKYPESPLKGIQHYTSHAYEPSWTGAKENPSNTREETKKERKTALNRCKSFFGLKRDQTEYKYWEEEGRNNSRDKSIEHSFVLKGDSESLKKRNKIKRSKSMDIFKINLLQRSSENDTSHLIQKNIRK